MIFAVISRDNDGGTVLFGRGSYQWGLFDAGLAGNATITVTADASGVDFDILREGSLLHIFPQFDFGHWYGLIADEPTHDLQTNTIRINALELTTFLADVQNSHAPSSEYVDLAYAAWEGYRQSAGSGWGLHVSTTPPPTSGAVDRSHGLRGQSLSSVAQALGGRGRANGVQATPTDDGYVEVAVGLPALGSYGGALIAPLNCQEESSQASGRGVSSVTAEGDGQFATAYDAGARFPGRQVISADGGTVKRAANQQLSTLAKTATTIRLRASVSRHGGIRCGDLVPYIRAHRADNPGAYVRVVNVTLDEALLPTQFGMTVQVYEPNAQEATKLSKGPHWPGVRGTGSSYIRRLQQVTG